MQLRAALIFFLVFLAADSSAQFWKKRKLKETVSTQPTSLDPSYREAKREYTPRASGKASKGPTYGLEQEFYERMEDVEKTRKKNERLMEKPQYSNPLYFGHKRPPQKRKPSKMKFCRECGIRH